MRIEKGLIVLEGIGGCGKDTQAELLKQRLEGMGIRTLVTNEHTRDTPIGELIEDIIKRRKPSVDPLALQMMFTAGRIDHTNGVIKPALDQGLVVIANRYEASTVAYAPENKKPLFLWINQRFTLKPRVTLIIDLDPAEAVRRIGVRNDADIFDVEETLRKSRESYLWYMKNSHRDCVLINGKGTKEEVSDLIFNEIQQRRIV